MSVFDGARVAVVGVGPGDAGLLTGEAREAIDSADCLLGARRMLRPYLRKGVASFESASAEEIAAFLAERPQLKRAAVLVSGDPGFYSLGKTLLPALERAGAGKARVICGVGSLQYFCARLGESWDDVKILSLHGRSADLLGTVRQNRKTFLLTGGELGPAQVCRRLWENGLGEAEAAVGENLSYPDERITFGKAGELMKGEFGNLAVMRLLYEGARSRPVTHGLPDEALIRGEAPMTKAPVRTVSVSALRLCPGDAVWDVGAGTGSVSVEIARMLPDGTVYAVEKEPAALKLLEKNREKFGLTNLLAVEGRAPEALFPLPKPDAVFIGGSGGGMREIIDCVLHKNPKARIVVNAITLETQQAALEALKAHRLPGLEILQLTAARARRVGGLHMMMGQNPVFIISAGGDARRLLEGEGNEC